MRKFEMYCVQVYLILLLVAFCYGGVSGKGDKRETHRGLFPFPRTGRSGESSWDIVSELIDEYMRKKQLMAFPRVGRSGLENDDVSDYLDKTVPWRSSNFGRFWFWPKAGHLHKRDTIYKETPIVYLIYGAAARELHYTPKIGPSEDTYEDESFPGSQENVSVNQRSLP